MGLLGKVAAYRWMNAGRGGGGGDGSAALVLVFAVFLGVVGVLWAVASILSFVWGLVYGVVHPILSVFPPVTVPLAVVLVGLPFTRLRPYSAEKTREFLDGTDDSLPFAAYAVWAVAAINLVFLLGNYEAFPEPNGIVGILLTIVVFCLSLYGFYELFHFPYRSFKLLAHAPRSRLSIIAVLSPMATVLITSLFDVPFGIPLGSSGLFESELAVTVGALAFINWTYLGGAVAVLWNEDAIRSQAIAADRNDGRAETGSRTAASTGSASNMDD